MKLVPMKVELIDWMGSDLSVVNAARVSFHKESNLENGQLKEQDIKLITYLAKHGHWTPFGHAFLSFRIKAPIFVARQLVKHQVGLVWNEVSRRYVDDEPEFFLTSVWRSKAENVKQGSSTTPVVFKGYYGGTTSEPEIGHSCASIDPEELTDLCLEMYQFMLDQGTAPEQARMILPQNTMTEWLWSGSLAAFARVCKLRLDPHAQKETRDVVQQLHDLVPFEFQHSWKALLGQT